MMATPDELKSEAEFALFNVFGFAAGVASAYLVKTGRRPEPPPATQRELFRTLVFEVPELNPISNRPVRVVDYMLQHHARAADTSQAAMRSVEQTLMFRMTQYFDLSFWVGLVSVLGDFEPEFTVTEQPNQVGLVWSFEVQVTLALSDLQPAAAVIP